MNAQLFVQQELKVLSSFSIVHFYGIRMPMYTLAQHAMCLKDVQSTYVIRLAGYPRRGWDSDFVLMSRGLTHRYGSVP